MAETMDKPLDLSTLPICWQGDDSYDVYAKDNAVLLVGPATGHSAKPIAYCDSYSTAFSLVEMVKEIWRLNSNR